MQSSVAFLTCKNAYARKAFFLLMVALSTSACETMDFGTRRDNFNRETRRDDNLAFVNFAKSENDMDPYSIKLNRDKRNRGYMVQAPLVDLDEKRRVHFTVSKTKEYKWFSGLQLSWEF